MSKRILVVLESIDVNDSSGTKGRVALINNLHKIGYKLKVLHYTRKPITLEGIDTVAIKEKKFNFYYVLSRVRRLTLRHFKIDLFKNIDHYLGFSFGFFNDSLSISKAIKKHFKNEDLVLTLSKGTNFIPHHAMLKCPNLYNKWASYIHDPFPYHCYPQPYKWNQPGYKQKETFFTEVTNKAKYSIFPSQLLKEWMGNFFPQVLKSGVVIPHQNLSVAVDSAVELPSFFETEKFNILHAGNLMKQRPPFGLIEGFQKFINNHPEAKENARLLLVGKFKDHKEKIVHYVDQMEQLIVHSNLPFNIVNAMQHKASANVILEAKSDISPFLPGKFPHCVYANKPIIELGPKRSEVNRLLGDDYAYSAEVDDVDKIEKLIVQLYTKWKKDRTGLKLNRTDLNDYLSLSYLQKQMDSILN